MDILVMSDSHRHTGKMREVLLRLKEVRTVLFLGDNYDDCKEVSKDFKDKDFYAVKGNCDFSAEAGEELMLEMNGKKILLLHGHKQHVKSSLLNLVYTATEREADICLFGHTHEPVIFSEGNTLFLNPGSISIPRGKWGASYGILSISEEGSTEASVVEICKNGNRPIDFES